MLALCMVRALLGLSIVSVPVSRRPAHPAPPHLPFHTPHATFSHLISCGTLPATCQLLRENDISGGPSQQSWIGMAAELTRKGYPITPDALYMKVHAIRQAPPSAMRKARYTTGSGLDGADPAVVQQQLASMLYQAAVDAETNTRPVDGNELNKKNYESDGSASDLEASDDDLGVAKGGSSSYGSFSVSKNFSDTDDEEYIDPTSRRRKPSKQPAAIRIKVEPGITHGKRPKKADGEVGDASQWTLTTPGYYSSKVSLKFPAKATTNSSESSPTVSNIVKHAERSGPPHIRAGAVMPGRVARTVATNSLSQALQSAAQFITEASGSHARMESKPASALLAAIEDGEKHWNKFLTIAKDLEGKDMHSATVKVNIANLRTLVAAFDKEAYIEAAMDVLREHPRDEVKRIAESILQST